MITKKPKMILFDYGQTLMDEHGCDLLAGFDALLQQAVSNKYNYTAEDIMAKWKETFDALGQFDPHYNLEIPNYIFLSYLFESMSIQLPCKGADLDRIFWCTATPAVPTEGIREFLAFLRENNIRTGVISNIMTCGEVLEQRLQQILPEHSFEFVIATSDYMFKKPNARIFQLALAKADLQPEDVWYIGNSYRCDVNGARSAGIFPVWYIGATPDPKGEGDALTISHWNELKERLEKIS